MLYEGFPQFSNRVRAKPCYRSDVLYGGYLYNISNNLDNSLMRQEPALPLFCTGRNLCTERSSNLPRITQTQSGRAWSQTEVHQISSPVLLAITLNCLTSPLLPRRLVSCLVLSPAWRPGPNFLSVKREDRENQTEGMFFNPNPGLCLPTNC